MFVEFFIIFKVDRLFIVDILEIKYVRCEIGWNRIVVVRLGSKGLMWIFLKFKYR